MSKHKIFKPQRRAEKTNFRKRLTLLKSGKIRLVVRITEKNTYAQLVEYSKEGDKILFAVSSKETVKKGWKGPGSNIPGAYLVGFALGKKASAKIKEAILDIGKQRSVTNSRIYAVAKGAIDGGIDINVSEEMFPSDERLNGEHIKAYAKLLQKEDNEKYNRLFSSYLKKNLKPEQLPSHWNEIKSKL